MEYAGYDHTQMHDRLYLIHKIIDVAKSSGLSAQQFYHNILQEVMLDDAVRPDGTKSYQNFNSIIEHFDINGIQKNIEAAKQHMEIDKMQSLLEQLDSTEEVFASWKNLQKYYDMTQLLKRKELLEKLKNIKNTNPTQYKYFETLLFHPKIDTQAVIRLFENPEEFF